MDILKPAEGRHQKLIRPAVEDKAVNETNRKDPGMMETFWIEIPGTTQARRMRVEAARWVCTEDFHLTSFDDEDKEIESWNPEEWIRLIEQQASDGEIVTKYVNLGRHL